MSSLVSLLDGWPGGADQALVHAEGGHRTHAEVRARAREVAGQLERAGVRSGEVVGVQLPDGADVVASLFGVWSAGAVYAPLNPRMSDRELAHARDSVRPAAVVTDPSRAGRFAGLPVVVVGPDGSARVEGNEPEPARHGPDVALVQFTSGTTGRPRPVLLRHSGVLELLDNVIGSLRGRSRGGTGRAPMPNLVPVSLSLWAGIYQVLFALRVGAAVVILGTFDTKSFARAVGEFGIRSTVLPPAAMAMLSDDLEIEDLAPLAIVRSISAPLSTLQARRFHDRFGVAVLNGYGQTEIGGEIIGWSASDWKEHGGSKLGSVGRPHAGVSVRILGPGGTQLGPDTSGELWVRTPALAAGYAEGSDLSDRLSPDGWFSTGDVARVDGDGFIWLEGRLSEMINRGGLKVFPEEVAEVLRLAPSVVDAAVAALPDRRLGEVPCAFVVPAAGVALDPADLERLCREHLAPYKVPVRFEVLEELPRNEAGKVMTRLLVSRISDRSRS